MYDGLIRSRVISECYIYICVCLGVYVLSFWWLDSTLVMLLLNL